MTDDQTEKKDQSIVVDRRNVMKAVGGTTVGISGLAGVASAGKKKKRKKKKKLQYHFYGCGQVCVNRRGVTAVSYNGQEFEYAPITRSSNRNDPPVRNWEDVFCYAKGALVGICYRGKFIPNPNRCAENFPTPETCKGVC